MWWKIMQNYATKKMHKNIKLWKNIKAIESDSLCGKNMRFAHFLNVQNMPRSHIRIFDMPNWQIFICVTLKYI